MSSTKIYDEIENTSSVDQASPHQLIEMLMNKCLKQMHAAKLAMAEMKNDKKYKAITNAVDIIDYLRNCLLFDDARTEELAKELDKIYVYLEKCLIQSASSNNPEFIDKALIVLKHVHERWKAL